jgi:hypothetical protein
MINMIQKSTYKESDRYRWTIMHLANEEERKKRRKIYFLMNWIYVKKLKCYGLNLHSFSQLLLHHLNLTWHKTACSFFTFLISLPLWQQSSNTRQQKKKKTKMWREKRSLRVISFLFHPLIVTVSAVYLPLHFIFHTVDGTASVLIAELDLAGNLVRIIDSGILSCNS